MAKKQKRDLKKALAAYSQQDFSELLLTIMVGSYVRGAVLENLGGDWHGVEKQVDEFLKLAEELGYTDLVERFQGALVPVDRLEKTEEAIMEEFIDLEFWERLETRLGQRDFFESLSPVERMEVEKNGWLPERVHEFYDKYEAEFEEHGIERLEIVDAAKKPN